MCSCQQQDDNHTLNKLKKMCDCRKAFRDYKADHERRIAKAFSELSVSQRKLLKALYEDGMTKQEYADAIGVSPSAISHRLEIIRKKLKEVLR